MVIKIKYKNRVEVKYFTLEEVIEYGIISEDQFLKYFYDNFNIDGTIENWGFGSSVFYDEEHLIDLRKIFNKSSAQINNEMVDLELCDVGTYEYTVSVLGLEKTENIYLNFIWLQVVPEWMPYLHDRYKGYEYDDG